MRLWHVHPNEQYMKGVLCCLMRASSKSYSARLYYPADFSRSITQQSRKKKTMNHVTFRIASHLTEGTESQSSGCGGPQAIGPSAWRQSKAGGNYMKFSKISNGLLLGMTLLVTTASAATRGSLKLEESVSVNGMHLAKGEYRVTWQGTGSNVQLSVIQSQKIVATVPSRLVRLSRPGPSQGYETRKDKDETTVLTAIYFAGRKYEMEIGQEPAATDVNTIGSQK
jgi:hypothetical protein